MKITINAKEHDVDGRTLSYSEAVVRAGFKPECVLTVVYQGPRKGDARRSGSLTPGQSVANEPGMIFSVADTSGA
jgi:hypothetical protein